MTSQSPWRRSWRRFRANRLGYRSLQVFALLFLLSLVAEVLSNDKPLVVRYTTRPDTAGRGQEELWKRTLDKLNIRMESDKRKFPDILQGVLGIGNRALHAVGRKLLIIKIKFF